MPADWNAPMSLDDQAEARIKAREEAAALQARIDGLSSVEALELDRNLPSLLVAINGGLVKIEQARTGRGIGEVLLPLSSTADAAAPGTGRS